MINQALTKMGGWYNYSICALLRHYEEEDIMKRTRYLVILMALIMALAMVACGSEQGNKLEENTSSHSNRDDDENEVEVEDPEPDEKPEVTKPEDPEPEVVEPEPEPVVEDDPNVIEDVDFTAFNEDGDREKLAEILNTMDLDGLRLIVLKYSHEARIELVDDVLEDGESYGCDKPAEYYVFALYQPKEIQNIAVDEANMGYAHNVHNGYKYGRVYYITKTSHT